MLDLKALLTKILDALNRTLLWENPNPNAVFNAQSITLNGVRDTYDFLEIEYLATTTQNVTTGFKKIERFPVNSSSVTSIVLWTSNWFILHRATWWISQNDLYFDNGAYNSMVNPSTQGIGNDNMIPYKIYGIKL